MATVEDDECGEDDCVAGKTTDANLLTSTTCIRVGMRCAELLRRLLVSVPVVKM